MMDKDGTVLWSSDTHRGSIMRYHGTTADGVIHDHGFWADATELKTGRHELALPYDSVEAAMKRLAEKYDGFHVVREPDALDNK